MKNLNRLQKIKDCNTDIELPDFSLTPNLLEKQSLLDDSVVNYTASRKDTKMCSAIKIALILLTIFVSYKILFVKKQQNEVAELDKFVFLPGNAHNHHEFSNPQIKNDIVRPPSYRNHKFIYNKVNNLVEWVHIVSPEAKTCGFSISVDVGDFNVHPQLLQKYKINNKDTYNKSTQKNNSSDTKYLDYPDGTAHLLEHSFFLTETIPERDIHLNWNAQTGQERSLYMFDTSDKNFEKGFTNKWRMLTEFGSKDVDNLAKKIRQEVKAVNNEYEIDINNFAWIMHLARN